MYGIRTNAPEVLDRLKQAVPHGAVRSSVQKVDTLFSFFVPRSSRRPGFKRFHVVYNGTGRFVRAPDLEQALSTFEQRLSSWIAEFARSALFVHAGVVEWGGKAIVIPGRSWSGKTTLVAAFVKAGARYYSDEYALLDRHGRVRPFARPLSIRGKEPTDTVHVDARSLGGEVGAKPIPVGLILVTSYRKGARFRPKQVTSGESILALLANTVPARRRAKTAITRFRKAVADGVTLKSVRGEAGEVVAAILAHPPWEAASGGDSRTAAVAR